MTLSASARIAPPLLLFLFTLLMLLPGTATLPLLDRDEPRFATATREMVERDDWIVPTFNGRERFDKPALSYWLMRAGYAVFGQNELGARFPNVLCAAALVLCVWWLGDRWFGASTGWLAGLGLASCIQLFIHGRLALADLPMILAIMVAQMAIPALLFPANRLLRSTSASAAGTPGEEPSTPAEKASARRWWWSLWVALGLGFLAKGPIALAVPVVSLLLLRFAFWRQALPWSRLGIGRGLLLALAIVAAWGIPALIVTEGRFFAVGIGEHVVQRGYEKFNGRGYNPLFYLGTAPLSLFPWIFFAPLVWLALRIKDLRRRWLASWLLAPYLIFTLYATQLPHYVLPAFPAFFLLLGEGFALGENRWRRGGEWALRATAVILAGLLVTVLLRPLPSDAEPLRTAFGGAITAALGFILVASSVVGGGRWLRAGLAGGALAVAVGAGFAAQGLRTSSLSLRLPTQWGQAPQDTVFVGIGFTEPSLVFYSHRRWHNDLTPQLLADAIARPGPLVIVTVKRQIDPLHLFTGLDRWKTGAVPPASVGGTDWTQSTLTGFNPGRTRWQELMVWQRK